MAGNGNNQWHNANRKRASEAGEKICSQCPERGLQPLTNFYKERSRDVYSSRCKECNKAASAAYSRTRASRSYHLNRRYGINIDQYDAMLASQEGHCAICRRKPSSKKRLAVDHEADTGIVRGLLCDNCNIGIGQLKHDEQLLENAINYLNQYRGRDKA